MNALQIRLAQPDVAGLPDWRAAEILNAPDPTLPKVKAVVAVNDAREILMNSLTPDMTRTVWVAVLLAAEDHASPVRAMALTLQEAILRASVINFAEPKTSMMVAAVLNALVEANIMTADTRSALLALGERLQSWSEANKTEVTARSVGLARGGV